MSNEPRDAQVQAPTPGENPWNERTRTPRFPLVLLALIWLAGLATLNFNATCSSDGCIGVFFLLYVLWGLTALQILIAIPISAAIASSRGQKPGRRTAIVLGASVLPALVGYFVVF